MIYSQYFEREDAMGRHAATRKYFQPLPGVTICLTATALLCALHNIRNGSPVPGSPILFDSSTYKGTAS